MLWEAYGQYNWSAFHIRYKDRSAGTKSNSSVFPVKVAGIPEHIKTNADIFDFELTDAEMAEIAKINKNVRYYEATPEKEESYAAYVIDLDSQE